jgi:hypothetical protein
VLPPVRLPFPSASGGLLALGCGWERWLSVRRYRLGPRVSRVWFPGDVGKAMAAMSWRNKSSRTLPHPVGAPLWRRQRVRGGGIPCGDLCLGVVGRRRIDRKVRLLPLGVSCATGATAMGAVELWMADLQVLAQASSDLGPMKHRVCPRPMDLNDIVLLVFTGGILLRLPQSFQAMVFPPVSGCYRFPLSGSGIVFFGIGFWQRRFPAASQASRELPKGFYVILVSSWGSYASLVGSAVPVLVAYVY